MMIKHETAKKYPTSMYLTQATKDILREFSKDLGLSQAAVMEMSVRTFKRWWDAPSPADYTEFLRLAVTEYLSTRPKTDGDEHIGSYRQLAEWELKPFVEWVTRRK